MKKITLEIPDGTNGYEIFSRICTALAEMTIESRRCLIAAARVEDADKVECFAELYSAYKKIHELYAKEAKLEID